MPSIVHDELIAAPSKGSYFNRVVKGNYGFRKQ
ncbi:KTSC domain-containing protein [Mycobacterium kansasii]